MDQFNCTCTDEEVERSFMSDVEAVKDLLPDQRRVDDERETDEEES